jgi:hypothetical protein
VEEKANDWFRSILIGRFQEQMAGTTYSRSSPILLVTQFMRDSSRRSASHRIILAIFHAEYDVLSKTTTM